MLVAWQPHNDDKTPVSHYVLCQETVQHITHSHFYISVLVQIK